MEEDERCDSSRSECVLAPVRTGRETPNDAINLLPDTREEEKQLEMNKKEPLPPITDRKGHEDLEKGQQIPLQPNTSSVIGTTMAASNPQSRNRKYSGNRKPAIVSYRREMRASEQKQTPLSTIANRIVETRKGVDGGDIVLVSENCQTEWSYLDDRRTRKKTEISFKCLKSLIDGSIDVKKKPTSSGLHWSESEVTFMESEPPLPQPSREDEYGIPVLPLSDSDYQRESEEQELATLNPEDRVNEYEDLYLEYGEDGIVAQGYDMFGGPCEFCGDTVKPFPTLEDQEKRTPAELYCCTDYKEFVHFMVSQQMNLKPSDDDLIDITPHAAFGSKQARKAAKERAAQRMREREVERQKAAIQAGSGAGGGGSQGPANFYQFAKQMKTINYQLSSHKYLEEGWTLRPPSPFMGSRQEGEIFEPEPTLPPWASAEEKASRQRNLILKYYEDGSKYLILFADGTGNVFYPSGRVAVSISSVEHGLYTVTAHDDDDEEPAVVAVFNPNGYGASYYTNGQIRICLEQIGGVELDVKGSRKRKWLWKDQIEHVHAPPLQPITFAITPHLALRIMNQDNMNLTFSCNARSCRFAVGSRLKVIAPENIPPPTVDEDERYREKARIQIACVLNKLSNVLRFPKSPKLDKIPTPLYLSARIEKLQNAKSAKVKHKKDPVIVN